MAAEGEKVEADAAGAAEAFESSAFEALEKDFQEVLQELIGDKSLEHFRLEYEKLHRALRKSHESEKRLIKKCRELNQEIVSNANKVQTALNLSKEDQSTIQNLKKEIERAWKMVEASHEKEQRAKETIHNLKVEIANLSHLVEQGAGLSVSQENTVNSLVQQRDDLLKNRDKLEAQCTKMTADNITLTETVQKLESDKANGEVEIANVKDMLNAKKTEAERENRRHERLDKEAEELRATLEGRDKVLKQTKADIRVQEEKKESLDKQLKEQKRNTEVLGQDEEKLLREIDDIKVSIKEVEAEKKSTHEENLGHIKTVKEKTEDIKVATQEKDKAHKAHTAAQRTQVLDETKRNELKLQRGVLKSDAENLVRELDLVRKGVELDQRNIADLVREEEALKRGVIRTCDKTKKQNEEVKKHEGRAKTLEEDVESVKHDLQEAIKKVAELDKLREKYGMECSMTNRKHQVAMEELKNRDNKLSELKKNFQDMKAKLGHQKQLYEGVRTDRNLFSKNLVESQDEIAEMKRKFKIMYHQIEQLKEEIREKEEQHKKEDFSLKQGQKQCEAVKDQCEKARKKLDQLHTQQSAQKAEIKKLSQRIHEAETERSGSKKKYEDLIEQRDELGGQLIRRNDELALLYEKMKIQQRTLQQGEIAYRQRLEESRHLLINQTQKKRDIHLAKCVTNDSEELKKEVFHLQRELLQERTKVKALSEELENPMNVHRWRKLEGQDPAMFEIVQKVKTLQKRLIFKTEEAVEKDLAIQEKEKLYLEMRNLLQKQPGPEVVQEVAKQQNELKDRTKSMKAMAAELNMYHAQMNDYKDEIERLTRELQDTKRRYFEGRHREQLLKDTSRTEKLNTAGQAASRG